MRWILVCALAAVCGWPRPLAAAERWAIQYFYDKNDSSLALADLQFPSARHGVALGVLTEGNHHKPVVLLTSSGGRSWEMRPIKEPGVSLFFLNERSGWMVSQKGNLWQTADGGRTWTRDKLQGVSHADPLHVFFLDASRGWLLCSDKQVYSTQDGGRSWQLLPISRKPDVPDSDSFYNGAAFYPPHTILFTGWSRPPDRRSRQDMELIPIAHHPTSAIILHSRDGGQDWNASLLPRLGEIARLRISPSGVALLLLHRPESLRAPSEIIRLDLQTLRGEPVYANPERWIADVAFVRAQPPARANPAQPGTPPTPLAGTSSAAHPDAPGKPRPKASPRHGASAASPPGASLPALSGPVRALAAAVEQQGRTPFPAIPSRLRVLESSDTDHWTEMEVDYRAEAGNAILAVANGSEAWLATDTGMILKLVNE